MPVALAVDTRTQHAFVRNGDGTVSVLDLTRGTTLRTLVVSKRDADAMGLVVDERAGRVFVVGNNVSVLDARSGAVLITRHLPRTGPGGVAGRSDVDEQTGRLFVPIAYAADVTVPLPGTVSVVDTATARVLKTIPVGVDPVRAFHGDGVAERAQVGDRALRVGREPRARWCSGSAALGPCRRAAPGRRE
jgi:DNA-binding beta-propeller fold protein YncE